MATNSSPFHAPSKFRFGPAGLPFVRRNPRIRTTRAQPHWLINGAYGSASTAALRTEQLEGPPVNPRCHPVRGSFSVILWVCLALLSACERGGDQSPASNEFFAGLPWRFGEQPLLTIGDIDGPEAIGRLPMMVPNYGHGVADLLSNDRIALADQLANEIRVYDRSGNRVATMGGRGPGPGEFQRLDGMAAFAGGDSIAGWENFFSGRDLHVSIFSADGAFARRVVLLNNDAMIVVGVHDDGSITAGMTPSGIALRSAMSGNPLPTGESVREALLYRRFSARGDLLNEFGPFPGIEFAISASGDVEVVLFGRQTHVHAGRSRLFAGDDDDFSIAAYATADGSVVSSMRRPHQPVPVPAEVIERRRSLLARSGRGRTNAFGGELPARETFPAIRVLIEDADENLWVNHTATGPGPPIWSVFLADGRLLGEVEVPAGRTLLAIGDDEALASTTDSLGVAYVHLYPLLK